MFVPHLPLQDSKQVNTVLKGKLRQSDPVPAELPMTIPEELLKYLFCDLGLEIPVQHVKQYKQHCKAMNCPWSNMSDGSHIPCALYGDSAKFSAAGEKITCIFFSLPLWNPRAARRRIWLLFALETYRMVGGGRTLYPFYREIVASMHNLYHTGIHCHGRTLRFVITELKGDWEWHCDALSLRRSWRNQQFCWRCDTSKVASDGCPTYLDFRDDPAWKDTQLTHAQFLGKCVGAAPGGACAFYDIYPAFFLVYFGQVWPHILKSSGWSLKGDHRIISDRPRSVDTAPQVPLLNYQTLQHAQFEPWGCRCCKWKLLVTCSKLTRMFDWNGLTWL